MFDETLITEAHELMDRRALTQAAAITHVVDPVARLWCRSFGVNSEIARQRLSARLSQAALAGISAGVGLDDMQRHLDAACQSMIHAWFVAILGRAIETSASALAIIRLAFIEANRDGRWADAFLDPLIPHAELASDIEAAMIEPTPRLQPRRMARQVI